MDERQPTGSTSVRNTVGGDEAAASYEPKVGDTVDLTGPVKRAPSDPGGPLRLEGAKAALVAQQGAYVNATTATKAR